jgi:ABC-type nitrate/sulfonate/bicarbonate transport system substrate-binding protein
MTNKFLVAVAAVTFALAAGAALAQQDKNNPAPAYSKMSPVQSKNVQHIQDGNNLAPRYSAVAPTKNPNVQHIQDGNNTAPRYPVVTRSTAPTGAPAAAKRRATHG